MPFDAGMFRATVKEINKYAIGARIDKIHQPEKEEIVFIFHDTRSEGKRMSLRLAINAGTNNPKISFTNIQKENPQTPPILCLLLRKHLSGARLERAYQLGFERALMLEFSSRDEMGFACTKYVVSEIMGKYSNMILLDGDKKIITAMKLIDFATSKVRQILPGMVYENPPEQKGKIDPLTVTEAEFDAVLDNAREQIADKALISSFFGLSPLIAREISYRSSHSVLSFVCECDREKLKEAFFSYVDTVKNGDFAPYLIKSPNGENVDFSFMPIYQYGESCSLVLMDSFAELIDKFFCDRDRTERVKQRAGDILHTVNNAQSRLSKKIVKLTEELALTDECEKLRREADLITSNIYQLKKGMDKVSVTDYYSDGCPTVEITLDRTLTPSQNSQQKYKKYTKLKNAKVYLAKQIEIAKEELLYIESVADALSRAECETELLEIRAELCRFGYGSKMKNIQRQKKQVPKPLEYRTSGGFRVLCGKNNIQNDYVTFHASEKEDLWFHVKNRAGSHAVMLCGGKEPSERDYTEAAMIAAYNSSATHDTITEVDYTRVKNIKKPPSAKPGYVIYHTNYSTLVKADSDVVMSLTVKNKSNGRENPA